MLNLTLPSLGFMRLMVWPSVSSPFHSDIQQGVPKLVDADVVNLTFGCVVSGNPCCFMDILEGENWTSNNLVVVCTNCCKSFSIFIHCTKPLLSYYQLLTVVVSLCLPLKSWWPLLSWSGVSDVVGCRSGPWFHLRRWWGRSIVRF